MRLTNTEEAHLWNLYNSVECAISAYHSAGPSTDCAPVHTAPELTTCKVLAICRWDLALCRFNDVGAGQGRTALTACRTFARVHADYLLLAQTLPDYWSCALDSCAEAHQPGSTTC